MYSKAKLLSAFAPLVGWRPPHGAPDAIPAPYDNPTSGLYVNDLCDLLSPEVLNEAKPRNKALGQYLTELSAGTTLSFFQRFLTHQSAQTGFRSTLGQNTLVNRTGRVAPDDKQGNRFVGVQLQPHGYGCLATTLLRVGLQLETAQTLTLHLFRTDTTEPLLSIPCDYNKPGSVQWFPLGNPLAADWTLTHRNNQHAGGPSYLLGYYENDLQGRALSQEPLSYTPERPYWQSSPYYYARPVQVDKVTLYNPTRDVVQSSANHHGLNLETTTLCDLTETLVTAAPLLAYPLQIALAIRALLSLETTPNITGAVTAETRTSAAVQRLTLERTLYGGMDPLKNKIDGEFSKISLDLSQVDPVCLPTPYHFLTSATLLR